MSYRLGVSNIYELLDDENEKEGSRVAAQLSKQEASKTIASKPPASSGSGQSKPRTTPQGGPRKENAGRQENTQRTGDRPDRRPRPDNRPPRQQRATEEGVEVSQAKDDRKANQPMRRREGPRPERRGPFVERAPGSAPTGPAGEGRERRVYERRSGTGRGREIKKGGGGRGNWGNITDTGAEEPAEPGTEEKTEKPAEGAQPAEGTEAKQPEQKEETKQEEEEEEDKTMTLDEYIKKKQEKSVPFQLPPPRQVESENPEWKKFVPLQRDEEELKAEAKRKKTPEEKKQKDQAKKEKVSVDEVFKVQDESPKRQQRERGPRDNKKGPRAGPGPRKGPKTEAPKFSEANFPALATTKA